MISKLKKYKVSILLIFIAFIILNYIFQKDGFKSYLSKNLSQKNKWVIQSYFSPTNNLKRFNNLEKELKSKDIKIKKLQLLIEEKTLSVNEDIIFKKNDTINIKLFNRDMKLNIFETDQFLYGINQEYHQGKGSAYIEKYNENFFILSSRGILAYVDLKTINEKNTDNLIFNQIKTNLNFISVDNFLKDRGISYKDIHFFKDKVYISYLNEIKKGCWTISIARADLNFDFLKFNNFFVNDECVNEIDNKIAYKDKTEENLKKNVFNTSQTGGRMFNFDDESFLFSTGEYRYRNLAQDQNSIFGKIFKVNYNSGKKIDLISLGHRNPQGLFFNKKENYVVSSEHGPKGGDEINLNNLSTNLPKNFGWPAVSYGEHYGGKVTKSDRALYELYPLKKPHKKFGFEEPLHYFVPSVGTSQVVGIENKKYILASMRARSIFSFEINQGKLKNLKKTEIGERIRDMFYDNNTKILYLFLENSSSIGFINLENI